MFFQDFPSTKLSYAQIAQRGRDPQSELVDDYKSDNSQDRGLSVVNNSAMSMSGPMSPSTGNDHVPSRGSGGNRYPRSRGRGRSSRGDYGKNHYSSEQYDRNQDRHKNDRWLDNNKRYPNDQSDSTRRHAGEHNADTGRQWTDHQNLDEGKRWVGDHQSAEMLKGEK